MFFATIIRRVWAKPNQSQAQKIQNVKVCFSRNSLRELSSINSYTCRTHTCGQLSKEDVGKHVKLFGWVQYTRFNNKIVSLRDSYGSIQCIIPKEKFEYLSKQKITNESVLEIQGIVQERPKSQENKKLVTGEIEIAVDKICIHSEANENLPILTRDTGNPETTQANRLKYRYLDLRSNEMQTSLRIRSKLYWVLRNRLCELKFVECETPTLFNRTPGGANEFIVPTQQKDKYYSLVQSPQQLKQLLMIAGLDRYFQICRCYRDESGRADRQPEFTQLDIELSFTSQEMIMKLVNELLFVALAALSDSEETLKILTSSFTPELNIRRISFEDAFNLYGTDKPDLRFDWPIETDSRGWLLIRIPHDISGIELKVDPTYNEVKYDVTTPAQGQTIVRTMEANKDSRKFLGNLRRHLAEELEMRDVTVYKSMLEFVWVVDFPLFSVNESGLLEPNHHPFTAPTNETLEFLSEDPLKVIGQHYDLVLNGQEVAGGSMRIHDAQLQRRIFADILKVDESTFGYFIEALRSGCPPHGGIALGLDRLIAILLGRKSIRDVIAFPKSTSGRDLMTDCPQEIDTSVKQLYHIKA